MAERLGSWKEIASYLGREVRTVQRWALSRHLPVHHLPGGRRPRVFSTTAEIDEWIRAGAPPDPGENVSVAVLRFLNLAGGTEDRYFADGLADDIIDALVRIQGLRVIARTSSFACASQEDDVRRIGARLGATWLLEGSIRRDGRRVRVSAQLVNGRDGVHAWSQRFDREITDLFGIQDEIARAIALQAKVTIAPQPPVSRPTDDPEAYDLWVRGRSVSQMYTAEAVAEARKSYEAAIARDPRFSRPWFGMADLLFYSRQFGLGPEPDLLSRARQSVVRSLELDDRFGEAHALLGTLQGMLDYDWRAAETSFERARRLSPGSAKILGEHAWYHLTPRRQFEQAVQEAQQAVELDPLSPRAHGTLSLVLVCAGDTGRAVEAGRTAVQLAPGLWWLHWFYGTALLAHGRVIAGLRESRKVYDEVHDPLVVGCMAGLYGMFLQRRKAKSMLAELEEISRRTAVTPFAFAFAYLGLGDDRVFEWLDRAIDARDPLATHLPSMPFYRKLHRDRRFETLLRRMNLSEPIRRCASPYKAGG